jgi:hypothetical protein
VPPIALLDPDLDRSKDEDKDKAARECRHHEIACGNLLDTDVWDRAKCRHVAAKEEERNMVKVRKSSI